MNNVNRYKLDLMVEEFSFLDEILRRRENAFSKESTDVLEDAISRYGNNPGFRIEDEGDWLCASYLEVPDSITVKKGDKNLLSQTPSYDEYSWCGGGHYDHKSYYAVLGSQIVLLDESGSSQTGSGDNETTSAPCIGEQLLEKKLNPDFIVCYDFMDTDDNGNGEPALAITIFKMKGFDLVDYHCRQIDKAAAKLKAEIISACKGGDSDE